MNEKDHSFGRLREIPLHRIDVSAMSIDMVTRRTNLVETDVAPATVTDGVISALASAHEIVTYRFEDPIFADGFESGNTTGWSSVTQ